MDPAIDRSEQQGLPRLAGGFDQRRSEGSLQAQAPLCRTDRQGGVPVHGRQSNGHHGQRAVDQKGRPRDLVHCLQGSLRSKFGHSPSFAIAAPGPASSTATRKSNTCQGVSRWRGQPLGAPLCCAQKPTFSPELLSRPVMCSVKKLALANLS